MAMATAAANRAGTLRVVHPVIVPSARPHPPETIPLRTQMRLSAPARYLPQVSFCLRLRPPPQLSLAQAYKDPPIPSLDPCHRKRQTTAMAPVEQMQATLPPMHRIRISRRPCRRFPVGFCRMACYRVRAASIPSGVLEGARMEVQGGCCLAH